MTCPKNGCLLWFQWKSTAASESNLLTLGHYPWHFELIGTNVAKTKCKCKAMSEHHVDTCIDWASFNFWSKYFLSNLPQKIIIYFVSYQLLTTLFPRSDLSYRFSVLTFLRNIKLKMCWENLSSPINTTIFTLFSAPLQH